jgi:acetyl esterase
MCNNLTVETKEFLAKLGERKPLCEMSLQAIRESLNELQEIGYEFVDADEYGLTITAEGCESFNAAVFRPAGNKETLPVILYIHGGGWAAGDKSDYNMFMRKLCNKANAVIVFPEYCLSPEAKFPAALNQVYETLEYIFAHAQDLNIHRDKIAIAGDSAGGNMAAVTAIRALKSNGPKIKMQLLLYPVTDVNMDYKSFETFENGPFLTKERMEWYFEQYLPNGHDKNNFHISPIKASLENLKGLPHTLIITAENDILRDQGEAYALKLDEAGVDVANIQVNGTIHDFLSLNGLAHTMPAKAGLKIVSECLKKHLHE